MMFSPLPFASASRLTFRFRDLAAGGRIFLYPAKPVLAFRDPLVLDERFFSPVDVLAVSLHRFFKIGEGLLFQKVFICLLLFQREVLWTFRFQKSAAELLEELPHPVGARQSKRGRRGPGRHGVIIEEPVEERLLFLQIFFQRGDQLDLLKLLDLHVAQKEVGLRHLNRDSISPAFPFLLRARFGLLIFNQIGQYLFGDLLFPELQLRLGLLDHSFGPLFLVVARLFRHLEGKERNFSPISHRFIEGDRLSQRLQRKGRIASNLSRLFINLRRFPRAVGFQIKRGKPDQNRMIKGRVRIPLLKEAERLLGLRPIETPPERRRLEEGERSHLPPHPLLIGLPVRVGRRRKTALLLERFPLLIVGQDQQLAEFRFFFFVEKGRAGGRRSLCGRLPLRGEERSQVSDRLRISFLRQIALHD